MKKLSIGILAHVDAGKTTLTESILYLTGVISSQGRVDNKDTFLDTEALEKKRGVTIVSKQAVVTLDAGHALNKSGEDVRLTFIDTPGHADFVAETERSLWVMDLAVLLISAADRVTEHTRKLIYMLNKRRVPYIVFINKTDMVQEDVCDRICEELGDGAFRYVGAYSVHTDHMAGDHEGHTDATHTGTQSDEAVRTFMENAAALSERTLEKYLEEERLDDEDITYLIRKGLLHPVIRGSALNNSGTDELMRFITAHMPDISYRDELSGKIYKITYENGHKISHIKLTGGHLYVRDTLPDDRLADEKITQIRLYSGRRYESVSKAAAGDSVALVGLENTFAGMGIGREADDKEYVSRPVLRYDMILPKDVPVRVFLPKLKEILAQNPEMALGEYTDKTMLQTDSHSSDRIGISVMGRLGLEILAAQLKERFDIDVTFDNGSVIYKETIAGPVVGFGHFEPLRHYAEVHILMEPLPIGSGIEVASDVSVDELDINWQKTVFATIMTELPEGVLTSAALTDMKFTLIAGKAHTKHSQSTDFKEATKRAIRQGLMKGESILLEPCYEFTIKVPVSVLGKTMNDIGLMDGEGKITAQDEDYAYIEGMAPAEGLANYQSELTGYSSGRGIIDIGSSLYRPCTTDKADSVIAGAGYDPDSDPDNISGSVFTEHGAGNFVPWYECEDRMHLPDISDRYLDDDVLTGDEILNDRAEAALRQPGHREGSLSERLEAIGTDEIDQILRSSTHANAGQIKRNKKKTYKAAVRTSYGRSDRASSYDGDGHKGALGKPDKKAQERKRYLLVDGYNIIHAWDELKVLTGSSIELEGARYKLLDMLSEYAAVMGLETIAVFDAYKVSGHMTEKLDYMGIHVVYTKEAETADQYIAKFSLENARESDITVATSDSLIQLIIRGEETHLMSARELREDVRRVHDAAIVGIMN